MTRKKEFSLVFAFAIVLISPSIKCAQAPGTPFNQKDSVEYVFTSFSTVGDSVTGKINLLKARNIELTENNNAAAHEQARIIVEQLKDFTDLIKEESLDDYSQEREERIGRLIERNKEKIASLFKDESGTYHDNAFRQTYLDLLDDISSVYLNSPYNGNNETNLDKLTERHSLHFAAEREAAAQQAAAQARAEAEQAAAERAAAEQVAAEQATAAQVATEHAAAARTAAEQAAARAAAAQAGAEEADARVGVDHEAVRAAAEQADVAAEADVAPQANIAEQANVAAQADEIKKPRASYKPYVIAGVTAIVVWYGYTTWANQQKTEAVVLAA